METLTLDNLHITYGKQTVLNDFSYVFFPGKVYLLSGASGIGKTTLVKAIAGHLLPERGTIRLGSIIQKPTKNIFLINQVCDLFPWKTVSEHFDFLKKVFNQSELELSDKTLSLYQLADSRHKYPHELSGGMKKRLSLLLASLSSADVFILDESLDSTDEKMTIELMNFLLADWKSKNKIIILISHHENRYQSITDETICLK